MHLTYDSQFNIAYIRLRAKRAKVTTVAVSDKLNVDLGPDGRVYGIDCSTQTGNSGRSGSRS